MKLRYILAALALLVAPSAFAQADCVDLNAAYEEGGNPDSVFTAQVRIPDVFDYVANSPSWGDSLAQRGGNSVTGKIVALLDTSTTNPAAAIFACGDPLNAAEVAGNIALISRGGCEFGRKALNAELAGATAVIIHNGGPAITDPTPAGQGCTMLNMGPGAVGAQVTIPVTSLNFIAGQEIRALLDFGIEVNATIIDTGDYSGTSSVEDGEVVSGFRLSQAYPNPFNPVSQFTVQVGQSQEVTVTLYDLMGREIRTLFSGLVAAGAQQQITLDGTGLPSGVYFYRAVGRDFTQTQSVTLAK